LNPAYVGGIKLYRILLGHDSGGNPLHELIRTHFSPAFGIAGKGFSAF
jgi:hypothetical protein